jgi:hypothetical protein
MEAPSTCAAEVGAVRASWAGRSDGYARVCDKLFARGDTDLPLPRAVRSAMLAAKAPGFGECRFDHLLPAIKAIGGFPTRS